MQLIRSNFYNKFTKILLGNLVIRKIKNSDQEKLCKAMQDLAPNEAFLLTSKAIKNYSKNKAEYLYILDKEEENILGRILVYPIKNNENAIGVNYESFINITKLELLPVIKRFILFARYTFKVEKVFFTCNSKEKSFKLALKDYDAEYALDAIFSPFTKEKSIYIYNMY